MARFCVEVDGNSSVPLDGMEEDEMDDPELIGAETLLGVPDSIGIAVSGAIGVPIGSGSAILEPTGLLIWPLLFTTVGDPDMLTQGDP